MNQHGSISEEETKKEFNKQVTNAWKDINEECMTPTVLRTILTRVLNFARVMDVVYENEDGYTHSGTVLKDF